MNSLPTTSGAPVVLGDATVLDVDVDVDVNANANVDIDIDIDVSEPFAGGKLALLLPGGRLMLVLGDAQMSMSTTN